MSARLLAAALPLAIILGGCGDSMMEIFGGSGSDASDAATGEIEAAPEPAPTPTPAPAPMEFGGSENMIFRFNEPLTDYRIVARFATDTREIDETYAATTPPMPLVFDALAVTQRAEAYLVQLRENETTTTIGSCSVLRLCEVIFTSSSNGSSVSINGETVSMLDTPRPLSRAVIGQGFRERFWTGAFTEFSICGDDNVEYALGLETDCTTAGASGY